MSSLTSTKPDVTTLLDQMSLEEKVGQMTQVTLHVLCKGNPQPPERAELDPDRVQEALVRFGVGSVFNVAGRALAPAEWRQLLDCVQAVATGQTRLGIPVLFGVDAMHGAGYTAGATLFPHNLSLAATWDPDLVRSVARATALEIKECGIPWNFAPVLDVGRQPLWSRFIETFGEDARLATTLGVEAVRGHLDVEGVAACGKHYLGYSGPATGRDRTTAWIPDNLLREVYLPPFRAAVEAGVQTIMVNSGDVNGTPVHASQALLEGVLRQELGFNGVIVTDWEDVIKLHTVHRVAPTIRDAVRLSVQAGIDMSMTPFDFGFAEELVSLVRDGEISEERIDRSVARILALKMELGLFDAPVPPAPTVNRRAHQQLSLEAASQSIVLLQNDRSVLPLDTATSLAVEGSGADSVPGLNGPWTFTWQGDDPAMYPPAFPSLRSGLSEHLMVVDRQEADAVVLCFAETPSVEKPGDIADLRWPESDQELGRHLVAGDRPVILVLLSDRPRILGDWVSDCAAVLWCGRPGPAGAEALALVLSGQREPGGRLPFSYPRHTGHHVPYDHRYSDRLGRLYGLDDAWDWDGFNPRWSFGHGLSYTSFSYRSLKAAVRGGKVRVSVSVTNTGPRAGTETLQVFVSDLYASVAPAVERLYAFDRVGLQPGETREVHWDIPVSELGLYGPEGYVIEPGDFRIRIDTLEEDFVLG